MLILRMRNLLILNANLKNEQNMRQKFEIWYCLIFLHKESKKDARNMVRFQRNKSGGYDDEHIEAAYLGFTEGYKIAKHEEDKC